MDRYDQLLAALHGVVIEKTTTHGRLAICPTLGGRVFAEVDGRFMHRLDLDAVINPSDEFNNYGGANFWPAPEGGNFGLNYRGDIWYVQQAINRQPFEITRQDSDWIGMTKSVRLLNRAGTMLEAEMSRRVAISHPTSLLDGLSPRALLAFTTIDTITVTNHVTVDEGLIACWTLEQFDASPHTMAFGIVAQPERAINYDFYAHPGERIRCYPRGFTYRTDGACRGQIGIACAAHPLGIGSIDIDKRMICLRESQSQSGGLYFNIADNDQPNGPYSAADCYSIFNSDPDMQGYELETIGPLFVRDKALESSELISKTTFAIMDNDVDLEQLVISRWLA